MTNITIDTLKTRNPLIELWNLLRNIIQDEVIDPNTIRATSDSIQERNWIFPENPESNDERYPRGTIKFSTLNTTPYSANDFVSEITDTDAAYKGDLKGRLLTIPVVIGIFVKRGQGYKLTLNDNSIVTMKNQLLNDHLTLVVKNALLKNRDLLIAKRFEIVENITVVPSYDNSEFLFAGNVEFNVVTLDLWDDTITDGSLIAEYVVSMEAEQIEG